MNRHTQLSPEMQELWDYKMKEFEKQLSKLGREEIYELLKKSPEEVCSISREYYTSCIPDFGTIAFNLEFLNEVFSTDSRILTLKSQLKYCKNYLARQNIERELNRLYKERR